MNAGLKSFQNLRGDGDKAVFGNFKLHFLAVDEDFNKFAGIELEAQFFIGALGPGLVLAFKDVVIALSSLNSAEGDSHGLAGLKLLAVDDDNGIGHIDNGAALGSGDAVGCAVDFDDFVSGVGHEGVDSRHIVLRAYGKGSVQQVLDLLNNDMMKITIARYYTPSGANIDKQGIPPDMQVSFHELTEDEEKALSELFNTTKIADFVEKNPDLTSQDAEKFAGELYKEYPVEKRILKRLVMQEYYRTHTQPLYDLEYDIQLKAAVDLLNNENVNSLTASTKTVQELQEKEPESK